MPIASQHNINWKRLSEALEYYEWCGFTYKEVPWVVRPETTRITMPTDIEPLGYSNGLEPLGSAEQGFIQMYIDGDLPANKYCALTPCYRTDDIDQYHQKHFAKVELFSTVDPKNDVKELIENAKNYFYSERIKYSPFSAYGQYPSLVETGLMQWDLEYNGIEIGSYGVREYNGFRWAYGTGLAEPRFTCALNTVKK